MKKIYFETPLTVEECISIIARETRDNTFKNTLRFPNKIFSSVQGLSFRLSAPWIGSRTRNITPPYFFGKFKDTPQGTLIEGRFAIHPLGIVMYLFYFIIFLCVWVAIVAGVFWPGLILNLTNEARSPIVLIVITIWMFGPLIVFIGSWIYGGEQRTIINNFIKLKFKAKEVKPLKLV